MSTLTDDDLTRLLGAAAGTFEVPDDEPVRSQLHALADDHVPLKERPGLRLAVAATLVLGLGGLAVSGLSSVSGGSDDAETASPASGSSSAEGFVGVSGQGTGDTSSNRVPAPTSRGTGTKGAVAAPAPSQGKVVKTGAISLLVDDGKVTSTLTGIQQVATAQGAIVFASSTSEAGDAPTGTITLRVPVNRFEATVLAIRGLDAEVASATTKASDVTAQSADLQTQIRTLKATRERYLVILGRTDTVGEILSVQQRVDGVTGQIDQLEGRLRVLSAQSDLSTLTVGVTERSSPSAVVPSSDERTGISKAWHDAVDGFTGGVNAIISRSGRTLVVLLFLGALTAVGWFGYRVVRRRMV